MKKQIKAVIGGAFGDEGKGLAVDYFCRKVFAGKPILNIRHSGGANSGHTVVTPDCKRHVFHHFGAGSLNPNVTTYLGKSFIVNPILFWKEYETLTDMGFKPKVIIHPQCRITIPSDMMINQIAETSRGVDRHGSCGVGIFETINRQKCVYFASIGRISDIKNARQMCRLINDARQIYTLSRLRDLGVRTLSIADVSHLYDSNIDRHFVDQFMSMVDVCSMDNVTVIDKYQHIVFEGSQGLLLDRDFDSFYPHLTPSKTGVYNVAAMLGRRVLNCDIETCYVARSYFTRHGAGPFPTECDKEEIAAGIRDLTNTTNDWQGDLRYGYFDVELFNEVIRNDILKIGGRKSLMVTHLDETNLEIITGAEDRLAPYELAKRVNCSGLYMSGGASSDYVGNRMEVIQ